MSKLIDLTGKRFSRLLVTGYSHNLNGKVWWQCNCDCGNTKAVPGDNLKLGKARSCGCYRAEQLTKDRVAVKREDHSSYKTYFSMLARCYNTNDKGYVNYGGRGISVCEHWRESFDNFANDMGPRPSREYSIDRIDNDGNYEPSNCKWSTDKEQASNRRPANAWPTRYERYGPTGRSGHV